VILPAPSTAGCVVAGRGGRDALKRRSYILNSSATGAFNRAYLMMLPLRTEHPISSDVSNHKPFFEEH
jgi:hypothetical protein